MAIWGVSLLVLVVVVGLIAHAVIGGGASSTPQQRGTYTTPANGATRDGLACTSSEGTVEHYHAYLAIYANGQQVQVTPGAGIVDNAANPCLYPLHVHPGDDNIVHIESPTQTTYTLGQFFDIWGQPISKTQAMSYKADASHQLVYEVIDTTGHATTYTGDPWNIQLAPHETIYVLYNSPTVQPKAFTGWLSGE